MSEQPVALDAPLIGRTDLAVWARTEVAPDDTWARVCIRVASALVREAASQPTWTLETAPVVARIVAAQVALRGYANPPEGETSTTIGPIGSRLLDAVAEGFHLTEAERERLAAYAPTEERARGSRTWTASMAAEELDRGEVIRLFDGTAELGPARRVTGVSLTTTSRGRSQ